MKAWIRLVDVFKVAGWMRYASMMMGLGGVRLIFWYAKGSWRRGKN